MTSPAIDAESAAAVARDLLEEVIGALVRRGANVAEAGDAAQEAVVEAVRRWTDEPPDEPRAWLITVARRKLIDEQRAAAARRRREALDHVEPTQGPTEQADDTLYVLSMCCHPTLSTSSAIALTLRSVGGLTTAQIAQAFLVPEATMAQRISRAKRRVAEVRFERPGDLGSVFRVLYLIFNEGYTGDVDLADEAIRLARQLTTLTDDPEAPGLLALMLLHHARRATRWGAGGELVPLGEQDRSRWDTALIAEGVVLLQAALARGRLGEYQAQAAIAALHADAESAEATDWRQIVEWHDELVALAPGPITELVRAIAVGEADGPHAGLAALQAVDPQVPRRQAAVAYFLERTGDLGGAAEQYAAAACRATSNAERNHLLKQAARLNVHSATT